MKGKGFIKLLGFVCLFILFGFVDSVSASNFSNAEFNDLTIVNVDDINYTKPSSADVIVTDCENCTVEVINPINVEIPGNYVVTYNIKNSSGEVVEVLTRNVFVLNHKPAIVNKDGSVTTPLGNIGNANFNFTINLYRFIFILLETHNLKI